MFDIVFIGFLLFFSLLCFVEFIVFNEEILLALCFFSFIFFSFNTLSVSVFESFESRAAKFESDLLLSFVANKQVFSTTFYNLIESRGFSLKLKSFYLQLYYLSRMWRVILLISLLYSGVLDASAVKLNELVLLSNKLISTFQKNCVTTLLYPLIFKASKPAKFVISGSSTARRFILLSQSLQHRAAAKQAAKSFICLNL